MRSRRVGELRMKRIEIEKKVCDLIQNTLFLSREYELWLVFKDLH